MKIYLLTIVCTLSFALLNPAIAADIWVAPNGNDGNPGTESAPLLTIAMAQRKARELRRLGDPSIADGINIILKDGKYTLIEPLVFRPEDAGTATSPTRIIAAQGANPILSGGTTIRNWSRLSGELPGLPEAAQGKVWVADIPIVDGRRLLFRQMWVNGRKAIRASTLNDGPLDRILSVDKQQEEMWIPVPDFDLYAPGQLEFVIHQWWAIAMLRVSTVSVEGDQALVKFRQPESQIEFEHPWPAPFIDEKKEQNGNSAFYFANSLGLLNAPGEWYADLATGKLYYWPRVGEDLQKDECMVPVLDQIVQIKGTLDQPVSHLYFDGIGFEHATWLRPSVKGHVPLQAGWSITEAYKLKEPGTPDKAGLENQAWIERQSAAVTVENAHQIRFERCRFEHLAATGLDFVGGTHHNLVQGCIFRDIGGTGIQIGFFGSPEVEAHLPYDPSDERLVCQFETIANNRITDCTNEDWGCVGISVGYAHDINIEHNDVSHLNYSGICVGWGWTKTINSLKNNRVFANNIHHFAKNMYDVGGIYMLSAQPNTEIRDNSIHHLEKAPYAHIPDHFQYIYFDEKSSYIRAINNWTEQDKFFSNAPGPGNEWENNGPAVSDSIRLKAGLQEAYQYLLKQ
ncbi:right-handed parallel beta-helix repeat-containing protein [Flavilitoribacter nigricans]|uniref:Right handed beta helix domain-containing protein n=1 Tax=Flavilitoribacter nigricans (strain ATCC 23147 / DSM 23189 / NBRC 102662 / NCIMB 1420 / SS-2) TaxID=1122177 RepID=A0A2D0N1Q8_FLAN2|nr:right-handed parallel beta-helix repeat-containing protein [Flavilitoribacter nigricans]PHN02435.1 hypothetical protein CRP01_32145 [Flavilitoribacter nigricans DSM 23189 = NBRC 102662]